MNFVSLNKCPLYKLYLIVLHILLRLTIISSNNDSRYDDLWTRTELEESVRSRRSHDSVAVSRVELCLKVIEIAE